VASNAEKQQEQTDFGAMKSSILTKVEARVSFTICQKGVKQ